MAKGGHPGFKAVQSKIAKKYGKKKAGAKTKNPNLKKVKG